MRAYRHERHGDGLRATIKRLYCSFWLSIFIRANRGDTNPGELEKRKYDGTGPDSL